MVETGQTRQAGSRQNHKYGFYSRAKDVKSVKLTCNIAAAALQTATCSHPTPSNKCQNVGNDCSCSPVKQEEELKLILLQAFSSKGNLIHEIVIMNTVMLCNLVVKPLTKL